MKLVQIEIINNSAITGTKNPLQCIDRAAQAMFVTYTTHLDGAIYLMKEDVLKYAGVELDTLGIEWVVRSRHNIKDL